MDSILLKFTSQLAWLFVTDAVFLGLLFLLFALPLAFFKQAAFAVMQRNFVGYFSNPTGYVFLCLFVVLTSFGAFVPHEFFTNNLANLDQLNKWIAVILLLFIPAITMSIWADEKRQGTDELLLTLPAADFDIVVGKYFAAVSIFTVSLIFSQLSSYLVLMALTLGEMDTGLLFTTYMGYWFIGLAMLAIGMVASFLTSNLTVGFILGMLFNAPLVLAKTADVFVSRSDYASLVSRWSAAAQFDDFGRGVISLASSAYFVMVAVAGVYLSIVLIGSRHWFGGRDGESMLGHYVVRSLALGAIIVGASIFLTNHDYGRFDMTSGQVSSLSPQTRKLLGELSLSPEKRKLLASSKDKDARETENVHPIVIEAFISADLPEQYAKTRYDLLAMLKEFRALAGGKIRVNIHDNLARASDEARNAAAQFKILPRTVQVSSRGAIRPEQVILGVGMRCGPEQVSIPFLDFGVPVEYELVRSIVTVVRGDGKSRKKIGVVATDVQMMGGMSMNFMQPQQIQQQLIIDELRKQYAVEEVDLAQPLEIEKFDVLLAVQPSTLGPQQMENLIDAVKKGVPTAIFEDPFPGFIASVGGTGEPRRGSGFSPQQPQGDIKKLWKTLGIKALGASSAFSGQGMSVDLVWQDYNPYKKLAMAGMGPEFTFVHRNQPYSSSARPPFNPDVSAVRSLEEVLFFCPGGIVRDDDVTGIEFTDLLNTGDREAGRCVVSEFQNAARMQGDTRRVLGDTTLKSYVIAAHIQAESSAKNEDGKNKDEGKDEKPADEAKKTEKDGKSEGDAPRRLNVIYVADIDVLASLFVELRARPQNELFGDLRYNFDNVSFVLNVIDDLAGVNRFQDIRTRKFRHSTLQAVENQTNEKQTAMMAEVKKFQKQIADKETEEDARVQETEKNFDEKEQAILTRQPIDYVALNGLRQQRALEIESGRRKADVAKDEFRNGMLARIENLQLDHERDVQRIQNEIKTWALALPPIPPLILGLIVFARRRLLEREGIAKSRML